MGTKFDVLINLITEKTGLKEFEKVSRVMKGMNRETQAVKTSFSEIERGVKKTTAAIAKFNQKGKPVVEITETEKAIKKGTTTGPVLGPDISGELRKTAAAQEVLNKKTAIFKNLMSAIGVNGPEGLKSVKTLMSQFGVSIDKSGDAMDKLGKPVALQELNQGMGQLSALSKATNVPIEQMNSSLAKVNLRMKMGGQIINNTTGKVISFGKAVRKVNLANKQFNMSLLSLLFGFMALQRATGSFIRSALTSYDKATEGTGELFKETNKLRAAWEFLKFSLVDALSQSPLFQKIVEFLFVLVNKFNELPKATKGIIALGIVFLFLAATVGFVVVQMELFLGALTGGIIVSILTNPLTLVLAVLLLLILIIPKAREAFVKMFESLGKAALGIGKLFVAVMNDDWELAKLLGLKVLADLADAASRFAETMLQVMLSVGTFIVKKVIEPFILLLRLIDRVTGSSYAGKAQSLSDNILNAGRGAISEGITGQFESTGAVSARLQGQIDALLATREANKGQTVITQNNEINVESGEGDSSEDLANKVLDLLDEKSSSLIDTVNS